MAELEVRQDPNANNREKLAETRADASYNIAKENATTSPATKRMSV